jgi:hypothetical protein
LIRSTIMVVIERFPLLDVYGKGFQAIHRNQAKRFYKLNRALIDNLIRQNDFGVD